MDFYRPDSPGGVIAALASVYRASRTWKFYPEGHPTREKLLRQAFGDLQALLDGHNLLLLCGSTGFSFPDSGTFKDSSGLSSALAFELSTKNARKIAFLSQLNQQDLLNLFRIINLSPEQVQQAGGIEQLLADQGVRTIWVNQDDLSIILNKRREREESGRIPQGLNELEAYSVTDIPEMPGMDKTNIGGPAPKEELQPLLARLAATRDEELYLELVRQAIGCANDLISGRVLQPLLALVELLAGHADLQIRSGRVAEYARIGLEQLAESVALIEYVLDLASGPEAISRDALLAFLRASGPPAYGIAVEKLGASDSLVTRKNLAILLARIGEPVVPSILAMMGSEQPWHVVRNLASILGDIGSPEAVNRLQTCLQHGDIRVRKEAIRSLAKIGDRDAESAIIAVLRGKDSLLLSQAITSLGGMRSQLALADLMQILLRDGVFLKELPLKLDVLSAFAMIGERSVVARLVEMLQGRHLIDRKGWSALKLAIIDCLAKLGAPQALPVLQKLAATPGELGRACGDAIAAIAYSRDNSSVEKSHN